MARRVLANKYNSGNAHDLPAHLGMFAGALAGFCQVVATNPMEMVKIQMQVASQYFNGLFRKSTMLVVRELGLRGIYRGSLATLSRDVPFSIIFFQSSAAFKNVFGGDSPTLFSIFASGLLAGCLAATAVTPMDVIKTRLQVQGGISHKSNFHYRGILDCFQSIVKNEGASALFKGATQRCFIIAPLFGISLLVYEAQQRILTK